MQLENNDRLAWIVFFIFCIIRIVISLPLYAVVDTCQDFDDMLFVRQALSLAHGHWLGPYDSLTLCKGPGYSIFLYLVHRSGLPYLGVLAVLRCLCVGYLLYCCRSFFRHRWLWVFLGLVLVFDPLEVAGRLLRNDLYLSLASVFLGVLINLFVPRGRHDWGRTLVECLFVALCFGMFWFVREEAVLLLVTLAAAGCCVLLCRFIFHKPVTIRYAAAGLLGVVVFHYAIALTNNQYYNSFVTIETTSNPYKAAYATFLSVKDPVNKPGIIFSKEKVHEVARYVPAMARLEACMTAGPVFEGWRANTGAFSEEAGDWTTLPQKDFVAGSLIEWQLRQCAEKQGVYKSGPIAARFYGNMKQELDAALAAGQLHNAPGRIVFGSFFVDAYDTKFIVPLLGKGIWQVFFAGRIPITIEDAFSQGDPDLIRTVRDAFGLHVRVKEHPEAPSGLAELAYAVWGGIVALYGIVPKVLVGLGALAFFPALLYSIKKRDVTTLSVMTICSVFIVSRYVILALIHVRGFYALYIGYFSAGYIALFLLCLLLVDVVAGRYRKTAVTAV